MKSSRKRKVTAAFFAAAALGGVAHAAPTLNMNDLVGSNTTTESTTQSATNVATSVVRPMATQPTPTTAQPIVVAPQQATVRPVQVQPMAPVRVAPPQMVPTQAQPVMQTQQVMQQSATTQAAPKVTPLIPRVRPVPVNDIAKALSDQQRAVSQPQYVVNKQTNSVMEPTLAMHSLMNVQRKTEPVTVQKQVDGKQQVQTTQVVRTPVMVQQESTTPLVIANTTQTKAVVAKQRLTIRDIQRAERERLAQLATEEAAQQSGANQVDQQMVAQKQAEAQRQAAILAEQQRQMAMQVEQQRVAQQQAEQQRLAAQQAEAQRQAAMQAEQQRLAAQQAEAQRQAALRAEQERIAAEQAEQARIAEAQRQAAEQERLRIQEEQRRIAAQQQAEQQRLAAQQAEAQRQAALKAEQERIAAEQAEAQRQAAIQAEQQRLAAQQAEAQRQAAMQAEQQRIAQQQAEAQRQAAMQAEQQRIAAEQAEAQRQAALQAEQQRIAAEQAEAQRQAALKAEQQRIAAEQAEAQRQAALKAEQDRIAAEQAEAQRQAALIAEQDRIAAEQAARQRAEAAAKAEAERQAALKAEQERIAAQQAEAQRQAALKAEQDRIAAQQAEAQRQAALKAEQERIAAEQAEAQRQAALKAEQDRIAAQQAELARQAAIKEEQERLAAEQLAKEEAEAAAKAQAEAEAKAKAEADAKAKAQAEAEAEAKAKAEAAAKAQAEAEAKAKAEAEATKAQESKLPQSYVDARNEASTKGAGVTEDKNILSQPMEPPLQADTSAKISLAFDVKNYESMSTTVDNKEIKYRAFEYIPYVANPIDIDQQYMNIYVPEEYFNNGTVNGYNTQTAPIFMPNAVGGYMPSQAMTPKVENGKPNSVLYALSRGYVVASPATRGRTNKASDGNFIGKAPAVIVDLQAATAYLHANDSTMPGNANRIITNGTSAGGAVSLLQGATGNNSDFQPYLQALGAATAATNVYAVSAYAPITNLDAADMAYEWSYKGITSFNKVTMGQGELPQANVGGNTAPPQRTMQRVNLNADDVAYSNLLSEHFPEYVNNLQLHDSMGRVLKLDKNGNGTFKNYVKAFIIDAANKAQAKGTDLSKHTYFVRDNKTGAIKDINWEAYNQFVSRSKAPGAFDSRSNDSGENSLFGTSATDNNHFTITAALHDTTPNQDVYVENAKIVTMMNPMNYLGSPAATNARYYRIRYGTADSNTSVAIPLIVGTRAQNLGYNVDMATPFDVDHSGDYDLDELFNWMDNIVKNGR
ncbi:MAG: ATPase [Veillonella dispar]|uniref:subtype B tannase n=1 Tax=Veillonella dispar TaxID=39778 RepID=UPI0026F2E2F2|nr:subtype B tannase [Veillonella dispar]MBS7066146.1 ATPase [Veillonella dispar]